METSFAKTLDSDYFSKTIIKEAYITRCYRAVAIISKELSKENGLAYLDKFVVADDAKGEGLGKTLWKTVKANNPKLFWRCRPGNIINSFYFSNSEGCYKTKDWNIFWYGIDDFQLIQTCVDFASKKKPTLN